MAAMAVALVAAALEADLVDSSQAALEPNMELRGRSGTGQHLHLKEYSNAIFSNRKTPGHT